MADAQLACWLLQLPSLQRLQLSGCYQMVNVLNHCTLFSMMHATCLARLAAACNAGCLHTPHHAAACCAKNLAFWAVINAWHGSGVQVRTRLRQCRGYKRLVPGAGLPASLTELRLQHWPHVAEALISGTQLTVYHLCHQFHATQPWPHHTTVAHRASTRYCGCQVREAQLYQLPLELQGCVLPTP